jgi:mono/diheme cytochrome c family protein
MKRRARILRWLGMFTSLIMLLVMAALAQKNPSGKSIELPADNAAAKLKPGPGADTTELNCMGCHSTDYIDRQPGADAEHWQAEVTKMTKLFGATISDEDAKVIVNYLATAYGPPPAKNSAPKKPNPPGEPKEKTPFPGRRAQPDSHRPR